MSGVRIRRQFGLAVLLLAALFAGGALAYHLVRPRIEIQLKTPDGKPLADVDVVIEHFAPSPTGPANTSGRVSIAKETGRTNADGIVKIIRNRRTEYFKVADTAGVMLFKRGYYRWRRSGVVLAPQPPEKSVKIEALQELARAEISLVGAVPIGPGQKRVIRVIERYQPIRKITTTGDAIEIEGPPAYHYWLWIGRTHTHLPDVVECDWVESIQLPDTPIKVQHQVAFGPRIDLSGVLLMPDGTPAAGLRMMVSAFDDSRLGSQMPCTSLSNETGVDGKWSVSAAMGDHYGYRVFTGSGQNVGILHPTNAPSGQAFLGEISSGYNSRDDNPTGEPRTTVLEPALSLRGIVSSESGNPVEGAAFYDDIHRPYKEADPPRTNSGGECIVFFRPPHPAQVDRVICAETDDAFGAERISLGQTSDFEVTLRKRVEVLVPKSDPADRLNIILLPELGELGYNTVWEHNYWRFGFRVKESADKRAFQVIGIPAGITGFSVSKHRMNGVPINGLYYMVDAEGELVSRWDAP